MFHSKNDWICCHLRYENLEFIGEYKEKDRAKKSAGHMKGKYHTTGSF